MVQLAPFAVLSLAAVVSGFPVTKRIAQTISDSTAKWEQACIAAGGADQCNPISVTAFSTLLAAAGPCEQQNSADQMIDLAKTLNNDPDMITFAQIFAQQPRNTPSSQSVLYCQEAPKNTELEGLFQCQFEGADLTTFVGGLVVGDEGTIPFGLDAPLDPPGSCNANPGGPVPDGAQLSDLTQDPGVGNVVSGSGGAEDSGSSSSSSAEVSSTVSSASAVSSGSAPESTGAASATISSPTATAAASGSASSSASAPTATESSDDSDNGDFLLQNGEDAQALNAEFAGLTEDSECTDGEQACINGGFAQCVGGSFVVLTECSGGTTCVALPLVNKAGTSIACTTEADAEARIAATGATGGITAGAAATSPASSSNSASSGSSPDDDDECSDEEDEPSVEETASGSSTASSTATASSASSSSAGTSATASTAAGGDFLTQNGQDAQDLNDSFAALSADTECTDGEQACVDGGFAQCVGGAFVITQCSGGTTCKALPLVNKAGTSITCTTEEDATARIASALQGGA